MGQGSSRMVVAHADLAPASASPFAAPAKVNTDAMAVSCGGFPVDLHRFRTVFPDRWAGLLKAHFNSDVRRIMFSFDVSERCVRDWLSGKTGPNAPAAIIAAATIPGAVEYLTRAA